MSDHLVACLLSGRNRARVGYKVHLTQTCDDDLPHVITNVETTNATTADHSMTDVIHGHLAERDLLPSEPGYVISEHLVSSHERQIDLLGPIREDTSWQTRAAAGFGVACFTIDWEAHQATCPLGNTSVIWYPTRDNRGVPVINIRFAHSVRSVSVRHDRGPSPFGSARRMKQPFLLVSARQRKRSSSPMPGEQELRALFHKAFGSGICDARATLVCPRHDFFIC
jgi:hypothetical protein